jgi:AraC-like DNA-binding protein
VASWKNATGSLGTVDVTARGVLLPGETAQVAGLRRDHAVAPELRPFVERYWSVHWDLTSRVPFRAEVLSHPSVNVSVESGTDPRFGFPLPAVLVHGIVTRRFVVDLVGSGRVTAAKFRPGGFRAFTGTQPARNGVTRLGGEMRVTTDALLSDVLAADDDESRAAALDRALAPHAPEPPRPYLELLELLERMAADRGVIRVDQAAALASLSVRSLQRLFAFYVGTSPKGVLARYRLQDAVAAIDAGEVDDLAGLASTLGWFDQAHFSRDFRSVVGMTPSAYLGRATADVLPATGQTTGSTARSSPGPA